MAKIQTQAHVAAYGTWRSPITAASVTSGKGALGQIVLDGDAVYWSESRPTEGGRNVIVRRQPDGHTDDLTPAGYNVRTRVHEYGGGAFTVARGVIYFANWADQCVYRQRPGEDPQPITSGRNLFFGDFVLDRSRHRLICVREDQRQAGREAINTLVALDLERNRAGTTLVAGNDFYSSPRVSPDGTQLAWLTWHHPNMPWDGTELWVGTFRADGSIGKAQRIAGDPGEAITQPMWSPDGVLHFVSDRSGWWNLYRWHAGRAEPLLPMEAEFCQPQWVLGVANYAFLSPRRLLCSYTQHGIWHLGILDAAKHTLTPIQTPYTFITQVHARAGRAVCIGASPTRPPEVAQMDLATMQIVLLTERTEELPDPGYISIPQAIEFPTEGDVTAHAWFYPPQNKDFAAPKGERPPLLVMSHGGPTSAAPNVFDLKKQFWTSRGIAVLDVNYGGSTGYGTAYRRRLNGQWGVVDVDDCINGARYLAERGLVDGDRLLITGGSAGGYTTLCALTFRDAFRAGASHFGLSELEQFVNETHKYESRYLHTLIGPFPERRDLYRARAPLHFAERLSCPVIFFQGLEDKIVPPNQAEMMVDVLRKKGVPVAYVPFAGEQHGFRRAENIQRALEGELFFYGRVLGFAPADDIPPVPIENLDG
jgi:dipeptidyl aminopeptidase/acylaminoacyl peptidase